MRICASNKRARAAAVALFRLLVAMAGGVAAAAEPAGPAPTVLLPRQALEPAQLAVIVNDLDPTSRRIGGYYRQRRGIPARNLIHVRFPPGSPVMDPAVFQPIHRQVSAATPDAVQAYVLTWTSPYRVGCMSVTTAFAAGYDEAFCALGCKPTRASPYFASASTAPYDDLGWRPTMALAGADVAAVKALIDRGVAADETRPAGTGYLLRTSDKARSVRAQGYARAVELLGDAVRLERLDADSINGKTDVLFYFTGLVRVPDLDTNRFLPGAVADHLTSTGGVLTGGSQMSSLRWLEAGATGSYGTVVEPCNLPGKFPDPTVLMAAYVSGATLIEAYWKSLRMPGQGIFIGEPLARPFGGHEIVRRGRRWVLKTHALQPGDYVIESADAGIGPYRQTGRLTKGYGPAWVLLPEPGAAHYRVIPAPASD